MVIWPKGTDWRKTGTILDPWWTQTPRSWSIREYEATFGLGSPEPSNVYQGQYPFAGGSTYTNLDTLRAPEEHRLIIERLSQEQRDAYYAYEYAQDRQRFIDALPPHLKKSVAVAVHSPVRMLITDSRGRRVGFTDQNTFVYEIPGATGAVVPEGDRGHGMVVLLPLELDHYLVQITGQAHGSFGFSRSMPRSIASNALLHQNQVSVQPGQTFTYILSPRTPDAPLMGSDGRVTQLAPSTISDIHEGGLAGAQRPTPAPPLTHSPAHPSTLDALLGEWRVVMAMLDGPQPTTLSIKRDGDGVVGTLDDRINAYLRLKPALGGTNYEGTWTDPQAGTVAVTASITANGALVVKLVEGAGGWDVLFNALRPRGGTGTGEATTAPTTTPTPVSLPGLSGEWRFNGNNHRTTLTLQHEGNRLTGTVYGARIENGRVLDDGTVTFLRTGVNQTYTGTFSVEPDGTWKLSGTFDCPVTRTTGSLWVATRDPRGGEVPAPILPERQTDPTVSAPAPAPEPATAPQPPPPQTGGGVAGLLSTGGLSYTDEGDGKFGVAFNNDLTIYVHQYEDTLRGYTPLGELPGGNRADQGVWALEALRLNYSDPLGRLSLYQSEDNALNLYWECQVPMSVASGPYVKSIAQVGANQALRWQAVARNDEPADIANLYPGGDDDALLARLKSQFRATGLIFEEDEDSVSVPYDNGVTVYANVYQGTAWIYAYSGGMPGGSDAGRAEVAIELLKRNWNDPVGRLSLDGDDDLMWECQVPMDYLSPAFLNSICGTAAAQMAEVVGQFGKVPFNG